MPNKCWILQNDSILDVTGYEHVYWANCMLLWLPVVHKNVQTFTPKITDAVIEAALKRNTGSEHAKQKAALLEVKAGLDPRAAVIKFFDWIRISGKEINVWCLDAGTEFRLASHRVFGGPLPKLEDIRLIELSTGKVYTGHFKMFPHFRKYAKVEGEVKECATTG